MKNGAVAILVTSILVLTGCTGDVFTTDGGCGEIRTLNASPDLIVNVPSVDNSDPTLESTLNWTVENPPADKDVSSFAMTTLPIERLALLSAVDDVLANTDSGDTNNQDLLEGLIGESFITGLESPPNAALIPNEDNIYSHNSSVGINDLLGVLFGEDSTDLFRLGAAAEPFVISFAHLPITAVATCGYGVDEVREQISSNSSDLTRLPDSSSFVFTPGYQADLVEFVNTPDGASISSRATDNRIPIGFNVSPWFSSYLDLEDGPFQSSELLSELLSGSDYELFFLSQLLAINSVMGITNGSGSPEAFFNETWFVDEDPFFEDEEPNWSVNKSQPFDQGFFEQAFLTAVNDGVEQGSELTTDQLLLGELEFMFVYGSFIELLENGDLKLTYSLDKYYPGEAGSWTKGEAMFDVEVLSSGDLFRGVAQALVGDPSIISNLELNGLDSAEFGQANSYATAFRDSIGLFSNASNVIGMDSGLIMVPGYAATELTRRGKFVGFFSDQLSEPGVKFDGIYPDSVIGALAKAVDMDQNIPSSPSSEDKALFGTNYLSFEITPTEDVLKFDFVLGMTETGTWNSSDQRWEDFISQYPDGLGIFVKSSSQSWTDALNCAAIPTTNSYLSMPNAGVLPPGKAATLRDQARANYLDLVLKTGESDYSLSENAFVDSTIGETAGEVIPPPGIAYSNESIGSVIKFATTPMTCAVDVAGVVLEGDTLAVGIAVANLYDSILPPAIFISENSVRFSENLVATQEEFEQTVIDEFLQAFAPVDYSGPQIYSSSLSQLGQSGGQVTFTGVNLGSVSSIRIDDEELQLTEVTSSKIIAVVPAGLTLGLKDLEVQSDFGKLKVQSMMKIVADANLQFFAWTKNQNNGTVKMYAKNLIGVGKVRFFLNGEEIAWVRATSAEDPKLRTAKGAHYLVRTVNLVQGKKNVLEVYVEGIRIKRAAYSY